MGLTAKGQPLNQTQVDTARSLLQVGQQLGAPPLALQACIFDAIFESDLGLDLGPNSAGYGGVLGGATSVFGDVHSSLHAMATSFFQGGNGFQAGGAIAASGKYQNVAVIGSQVTAAVPFDSQGISTQYESQGFPIASAVAEAAAIVQAYDNGAGTLPGGTFGAGGTGTPGNQAATSLWTVGDPSNPDQDYWTTINQYGMNAQWYVFSDAETLYVADGVQLMAQQPQAIISRLSPAVIHAECVYDNTAFQYTHTHTKKGRIQRRTGLAKLTSPTQITVQIICDIDQYRAGDTVVLVMFGPADGVWLIGDCTRRIYDPWSELTLVQAMQPINAASGLPGSTPFLTGKQASQAASGTVMAAMISEAQTISTDDYPYVYGGGHKSVGTPDIGIPGGNGYDGHTVGFDCSGSVAAVLAAGGLWPFGGSVGNDASIIQTLLGQNKIQPGQGTGRPECTLFDNSGEHIFMRLNGVYFGTSDGDGGNHSQPNGGAGWLYDSHADVGSFRAYHVPQAILGQQAAGG